MAIVGSPSYNSAYYSLEEVRQNVIKKSSFILSSLSDDGLISKYLEKVVEDVLTEMNKDMPINIENSILDKEIESKDAVEFVTEHDDEVLVACQDSGFQDDIDSKIDALDFDSEDEFSSFVDDFSADNTADVASPELVIKQVEEIQEAESFVHNDELKIEEPQEFQLEPIEEFTDNLLITPDVEIQEEENSQPIFDLPKEEFPTLNPETLYKEVEDPIEHKEVRTVPQEVTDKILGILIDATKVPETKDYIKIFYLKYIKKLKQVEIAKMLDMSEVELSEMYFKMVKYVKSNLY